MTSKFRSALFALGFTTLGATMGITAGAIAAPHRGGGGGPGIMKFAHAMGGLDLNEDQLGMLEDLREDLRAERKGAKGTDEAKLVLQAVADGKPIDREALHTAIDEASEARKAMAHKALDGVLDVYDSLDDDQKKELGSMVRERMEQHEQRKENFGDHPRGRR
mgnify:CR=1 FL=1